MMSPATLLGLLLAALSIFVEVQSRYIHNDEHIINDMQVGDRMALPMKRRMMLRLPFVENVNNNPLRFMANEKTKKALGGAFGDDLDFFFN